MLEINTYTLITIALLAYHTGLVGINYKHGDEIPALRK